MSPLVCSGLNWTLSPPCQHPSLSQQIIALPFLAGSCMESTSLISLKASDET